MMSREIDKLAAEKVMGWHKEDDIWWRYPGTFQNYAVGIDHWNPSSDISDAKRLTDKVLESNPHYAIKIKYTGTTSVEGMWCVEFWEWKPIPDPPPVPEGT